ncbi:MAG: two-component system chemotaxis response regulator CheY [Sulfurimonas sp.]
MDLKFKKEKVLKKVLVIDDSKLARTAIKKVLLALEYEVVGEAIDGLDGLQKCNELNPDLIIEKISPYPWVGRQQFKKPYSTIWNE